MMEEVVAPVLHNNVPVAVVDNVDVPLQLLTTVTMGIDGVVFGAAVPEPAELVQPSTVCITVYVPALFTIMEEVVAPVLHNNKPVAVVDKVVEPLQLLTTFTIGVAGVVFGAAVPEPAKLVQASTVCVTVYVPAMLTIMEEVVAPVLHNNVPVAVVGIVDNVDVPLQLLTTVTIGVAGVVFGAAVPDPASLAQPFTVCVTVYVPALLTVIEEAVSVVLHNNEPDAAVDKVDVLLQLLTTLTDGVAGNGVIVKFNVTTLSHPAAFVPVHISL
jgi:putative N-acetylmannosamine-6-phosphate epimerase